MNVRRVAALAGKEWREMVRDPIVAALAFLLAPLLMLILGYGLIQDVEGVPLAIADLDRTAASRDYAQRYIGSRHFDFRGFLAHDAAGERLMADGGARVVLVIPEGFEARLREGHVVEIQALIDGTFTPVARTVGAYVQAINAAVSHAVQVEHLARRLGVPAERAERMLEVVRVEVRYLYNQDLRIVAGIAPALVMFTLTLVAPLLTALSVVRERESGAIYNVYASTLTRAEFLAGKLLPNVVVGMLNALVLWALARWLFAVPFKGDALAFLVGTTLYIVAACAVGLVISLVVRSQQAALTISLLLSTIVVVQFSGMLTPVASLTGVPWLVARLLPPSHFNTVMQSAFLKGRGAAEVWAQSLVFVGHAAVLLGLAWLLFRKRVRA
jgi:ABC-2 type transport system permease protein/ribosome-dependent ATPase